MRRGGRHARLGCFATPEEEALSIARTPGRRAAAAAPPEPPPLTAEEALRQAEAEGLTLLRSESNNSGWKNVTVDSGRSRPYRAKVTRGGEKVTLGSFATAEEAALVVARDSGVQAAAPQPPAADWKKRKFKSEEQPPDMPAGARVKLEEELPLMPTDTVVKLESW